MSCNLPQAIKTLSLAFTLSAASLATYAADPVTDAMLMANAPYRMALYKTNGNSQTEALDALTQAQQAWSKLIKQFGAHPPSPYDRDPGFAASVAEVTAVYAKAQAQAKTNQLHDAHNTLERARDVMAELRQRNQVVVYSDHMNAYHAEMEKILIDGNATLAKPNGMLQMTAQTGALSYLAKRLATQAPTELTNNPEFTSLLNAVQLSVRHLESALLNQDKAAVTEAIGKLKGHYSKLFSKFG